MIKKVVCLLALIALFAFDASAQKSEMKKHAYHINEHVMVTRKDGAQVECVIHGHVGRKSYWVRQYHSGNQGKVKEKFIRPLSEEEVSNLTKKKE
ncbi:MAG: hypothetical protein OCD76_06330 [Reichenbachiella sp.]